MLNLNYDKKKSYSSDVYFMGLLIFFIIKSEPDEFSKVDPLIYEWIHCIVFTNFRVLFKKKIENNGFANFCI